MVERCKNCKRPEWTEAAEDLVTVCFCPGDANCELACRVAELEAQLAAHARAGCPQAFLEVRGIDG